jgi:hypothetical protein
MGVGTARSVNTKSHVMTSQKQVRLTMDCTGGREAPDERSLEHSIVVGRARSFVTPLWRGSSDGLESQLVLYRGTSDSERIARCG